MSILTLAPELPFLDCSRGPKNEKQFHGHARSFCSRTLDVWFGTHGSTQFNGLHLMSALHKKITRT